MVVRDLLRVILASHFPGFIIRDFLLTPLCLIKKVTLQYKLHEISETTCPCISV